jgi:hypothetical protein
MPFASASLAFTNGGASPIAFHVAVDGDAAASARRLHTERHETLAPAPADGHPLAALTGAGRVVGVCAALEGHGLAAGQYGASPLNFLEGDDHTTVDGAAEMRGTGTEDYFDSAFYFAGGDRSTPHAAWWAVGDDGTHGHASACRWHVAGDAIDFASSFDMGFEVGPGDSTLLDRYRSVVFYYR